MHSALHKEQQHAHCCHLLAPHTVSHAQKTSKHIQASSSAMCSGIRCKTTGQFEVAACKLCKPHRDWHISMINIFVYIHTYKLTSNVRLRAQVGCGVVGDPGYECHKQQPNDDSSLQHVSTGIGGCKPFKWGNPATQPLMLRSKLLRR